MKSVRIWSFSGPQFPAIGLNIQTFECEEIPTRKIPNTNTFHAVHPTESQNLERI